MPDARDSSKFVQNISTMIKTHRDNLGLGFSETDLFILKRMMVLPRFLEVLKFRSPENSYAGSLLELFFIGCHFFYS